MHRHTTHCSRSLALLSLVLSACEGPAAMTLAPDEAALAALEAETGHTWSVRRNPTLHTPAFLEGRTGPLAATARDADAAAKRFISAHKALFHLASPSDELVSLGADTDELGMSHARFGQRVGRVPVWGRWLAAHFDVDGSLLRVNGRYGPVVPPRSLVPSISEDRARVAGALLARSLRPLAVTNTTTTRNAELVLYPLDDPALDASPQPAPLAWHVVTEITDADQPLRLEAFFDAQTGEALGFWNAIEFLEGSGIDVFGTRKPLSVESKKTAFWLEDRSRGVARPTRTFSAGNRLRLPGGAIRSPDPHRWDDAIQHGAPGAAVDAHAHVAAAWDYFATQHGRLGFRGDGEGVRTTVHYGDRFPGAFFDGEQLVFGDGDERVTTLAAALDVVAHEYTHGVITATAGLVPVGESGAIGEGLADVFGCLVSWATGEGSRWQIGETVYHPEGTPRAMRDLADPHRTGQPAALAELVDFSQDSDGIHTNASIIGHLGYLLVEGAGDLVPTLGPDRAGDLLYRALVAYSFPRADLADFSDGLVAATRDLSPDDVLAVEAALHQLGLR